MSEALAIPIYMAVSIGVVCAALLSFAQLVKRFYIRAPEDAALIKTGMFMGGKTEVSFIGAVIFPIIHTKEFLKLSLVHFDIEHKRNNSLISKDGTHIDIIVSFYLRVNATSEDVIEAALSVGTEVAADPAKLKEFFGKRFSVAIKTSIKKFTLPQLSFDKRATFRDHIKHTIGNNLNGYILEDVAIDYLECTSVRFLTENREG